MKCTPVPHFCDFPLVERLKYVLAKLNYMDFVKFLRAIFMIALVGSSLTFGSVLIKNATDTVEETANSEDKFSEMDIHTVVFWTYILAALGTATLVLLLIFSRFSLLSEDKFILSVLERSNRTMIS